MGIYIKGMKKPESCERCPISLWALPKDCYLEVEACPITEIKTPHGRLGDLDKALQECFAVEDISLEPTAIEAEVE